MPGAKVQHDDGDDDFKGTSRSFTVLPGGRGWPTCRSCGSTLYPQRRESSRVRAIRGSNLSVETFRCRCGAGYEVRREVAAA
jgi:hypothetical protein